MARTNSENKRAFIPYELLDMESLLRRGHYVEDSRVVFDATLMTEYQLGKGLSAQFREVNNCLFEVVQ